MEDKSEDTTGEGIPHWDESSSQIFIDYGQFFVPDRDEQIDTMVSLLALFPGPFRVLELACGEGRLAETLLERYSQVSVTGLDGSQVMLQRANERLARFKGRYQLGWFELSHSTWRQLEPGYNAVLSSLAVHHLNTEKKQELFQDVFKMLFPGGIFLLGDIILPASQWGIELAAHRWEETVKENSLRLKNNLDAYQLFLDQGWNTYRFPDAMDMPSPLFDQLQWLESAGFINIDVFWMRAGHAIIGGQKQA